jgi:hypothetical protein
MANSPPNTGPRILRIDPDGTPQVYRLPRGGAFMMRAIQHIVGGYFEAIGGRDWVVYVNEDGKRLAQQPNPKASALAMLLGFNFRPGDGLSGPAVFLGRRGTQETDIPPGALVLAAELFRDPALKEELA